MFTSDRFHSNFTRQVDRYSGRETAAASVPTGCASGIRAQSDCYVRFTIEVESCIFGRVPGAVGWVAGHDGLVLVVEEHMWRRYHVPRTAVRISIHLADHIQTVMIDDIYLVNIVRCPIAGFFEKKIV